MLNILKHYTPSDDYLSDLALIKAHFLAQGFKVKENADSITCSKGSLLRNLIAMNPLSWQSEHFVRLVRRRIEIRSTINDSGQSVTDDEIRLWHSFLDSIEQLLIDRTIDNARIEKARSQNRKNNLIYFVCLIGGLIGGGFMALLLTNADLIHEDFIRPIIFLGVILGHFIYYKWLIYDGNNRFR